MLLDAIPSSVLLIDQDLRIVSVNRNFLEKNRRTLPDTIGHRLEEVFPAIIIDQMDFPGRIRQVFEKDSRIKGERMTYRAPGIPLRIYYYSIIPFSWPGVVELAMLLMDDVTEQVRLSEEVRRVTPPGLSRGKRPGYRHVHRPGRPDSDPGTPPRKSSRVSPSMKSGDETFSTSAPATTGERWRASLPTSRPVKTPKWRSGT